MKENKKIKSALTEVDGIKKPKSLSNNTIHKIKLKKAKQPSVAVFVKEVLAGNIAFLSKAITLIESTNSKHKQKATEIINACLPFANKSIRIGITGVPGVGKSTFIESFGGFLSKKNHRIAVLAIDPTSSVNHGSILGDKTRMAALVKDENVYIRPSASGKNFGGVARKTREAIILCEAAGFNIILIETVGVGQSETLVHSMVDFFLLLKLAGAGDELQGIKRGIIEMADTIVINKVDEVTNASLINIAITDFKNALHLYPLKESNWQPRVLTASGLNGTGIAEIWNTISAYIKRTKTNDFFDKKRIKQNEFWLMETINLQIQENFYKNPLIKKELISALEKIKNAKTSPFQAANMLLQLYYTTNK